MLKKILLSFIIFISVDIYETAGQNLSPGDTLIRLKEFEVTDFMGKQVFQHADTIGETMISREAVRDIGDYLRSQPNISGIRKGGTGIDPVIRGFKFSQLNVQVNEGQKIEPACPNRMDPPTAHIDIDDIQTIEIFKGPYALRFGPNFGGVIHLHTWTDKKPDHFQVDVTAVTGYESAWNGIKEHLAASAGNPDFLVKLSGNYKKYGDYKDGYGNTVPSSFERYNYTGLLILTPWKHHSFTLSYDHAIGKNLDFPSLPMDERLDNTNLYSFDYIYKNPERQLQGFYVKLYQSDVNHEMDNKQRPFSDTTVAVSKINAVNTGYRLEASLGIAGGTLHAGTDMEDIRKDGTRTKYMILQPTMPVKKEKLWDNAHISNYGLFAEYSVPVKNVNLVAAARMDFNSAGSDPLEWDNMQGQPVYYTDKVNSSLSNFSFSAGADWWPRDDLRLGLSAGRGVRSPDMTERFIILLPIGYDNYDYIGNPGLKSEKNYEADLSVKWLKSKTGLLKFSIFFSHIQDYITGQLVPESEIKPQTKGVYGVKQFINADRAWLSGFELEYRSPDQKPWLVEISAGYTYAVNPLATHYIIENGQVTGTEEVKNDPLSEIPPLEGTVNFSWKFFNGKLIPKANVRAVASQKRISKAYNERVSPGFVLAGLSLFYRLNDMLEISTGVDNLFNKAYYEHLNRNIVGSTANLFEPGRNFYINLKFKVQNSKL